MKLIAIMFSLLFGNAFASIQKAPPNFEIKNRTAVFVDILSIKAKISYDMLERRASVESIVKFKQESEGSPIFDLIPAATKIELNSVSASLEPITLPGNTSTVRVLSTILAAGEYELKITNSIDKNISFSGSTVKSAFWMSDLSDRRYLEQYLPANLEYDQYKMDFEVEILGTDQEHVIRTNGDVITVAKNHFQISYPEYFTASSIFYHLMNEGAFNEEKFNFQSIDGREIPVTVYSSNSVKSYVDKTKSTLAELEADYGPFPHNKVVIYGAGSGGMEYCGATITSLSALGHELTHSYFARGIMPARGNSGWVDEAVASWRDGGYRQYSTRNLSSSTMAGHSVYKRTTDRDAYSKGARFMGFLDGKFSSKGGLKVFLKKFKEDRLFKPFFTSDFQSDLEAHFGEDLSQEFSRYIYGSSKAKTTVESGENPFHPKLSEKQLLDLL